MRCFLMGWFEGVGRESGKPFKQIILAEKDDEWHGYKVTSKFIDPKLQIPDCEPGSLIEIDFDMNGFVQKGSKIRLIPHG